MRARHVILLVLLAACGSHDGPTTGVGPEPLLPRDPPGPSRDNPGPARDNPGNTCPFTCDQNYACTTTLNGQPQKDQQIIRLETQNGQCVSSTGDVFYCDGTIVDSQTGASVGTIHATSGGGFAGCATDPESSSCVDCVPTDQPLPQPQPQPGAGAADAG